MKKIQLLWDKGWESKVILTSVVQVAQDGIRYDEIKKRMRILDALENVKAEDLAFWLEDADWELLKTCINAFKFGAAHKSLVQIIEAVMEAESGNPTKSVSAESIPDKRVSGSAVRPADDAATKLDASRTEDKPMVNGGSQAEYVER